MFRNVNGSIPLSVELILILAPGTGAERLGVGSLRMSCQRIRVYTTRRVRPSYRFTFSSCRSRFSLRSNGKTFCCFRNVAYYREYATGLCDLQTVVRRGTRAFRLFLKGSNKATFATRCRMSASDLWNGQRKTFLQDSVRRGRRQSSRTIRSLTPITPLTCFTLCKWMVFRSRDFRPFNDLLFRAELRMYRRPLTAEGGVENSVDVIRMGSFGNMFL